MFNINRPAITYLLFLLMFVSMFKCTEKQSTAPDDTTVPSVSITSPSNDTIVSGNVKIIADANDNIGIKNVQFYIDSTFVFKDSESPYIYDWDTTPLNDETICSLYVITYDLKMNEGISEIVTVTIDNSLPNAEITNPIHGSIVSDSVQVSVDANDNIGIDQVCFYINNNFEFSDDKPQYEYFWDTTHLDEGNLFTLSLKVIDIAGNESVSDCVIVALYKFTEPTLWMNPVLSELSQDQTFSIDIQVENVDDLFGTSFELIYDSNLIKATEGFLGDFLGDDVVSIIKLDPGLVSIGISKKAGETGNDGSGKLASINFQALECGSTNVEVQTDENKLVLQNHDGKSISGFEKLVIGRTRVIVE